MTRILIVSASFPPYNIVGALRVGKTAKYLHAAGHDVRVIATRDQPVAATLPVEFPPERVTWTRAFQLGRPGEVIQGGRGRIIARGRREGPPWRLLRRVWKLYRTVAYVPDAYVLWYPFAVRAALDLARSWQPDIVLASAPPATGYFVARTLSRRLGVPWVAELRDLWVDDPVYDYGPVRRRLDRWLENRVWRTAHGIVVATGLFAEKLSPRFRAPIEVIYNSLDPADLPATVGSPVKGDGVRLVFTGSAKVEVCAYDRLFEAFRLLNPDPVDLRLVAIGRRSGSILEKAREMEVGHLIETHLPVTYSEALAAQAGADVLLLMNYVNEVGHRYMPAKFFEYIFARRPVLLVGPSEGEAAEVIGQRGLGFVSLDPNAIAARLGAWIREKREAGAIAALPEASIDEFTRPTQVARLSRFLERVVADYRGARAERDAMRPR